MLLGEMNNLRVELALLILVQGYAIDYILILMLELMMRISTLGQLRSLNPLDLLVSQPVVVS
jgi:hypothetical protein